VEEIVSSEKNRDKKRNNIKQALTIQALKMVASQTTAFAMAKGAEEIYLQSKIIENTVSRIGS